jgi:hypothetical protein
MINPVFRDKNGKTYTPEFVKLINTDFEINSSTGNLVSRKNGPNKQVFFIPHYACLPEMFPGVEFKMDTYNEVIQSQFSKSKLSSFGIIEDDVKIEIGAPEENAYQGYWGLKFPLLIDIPVTYYDDLKYSDINNSVRIFMDDTLEITNKTQIISFFGDTSLGSFHLRKIRHDKILQIPYSFLNLTNTDHRVSIYTQSLCLANNTYINKDTFYLNINNPELVHIPAFDLKFRIKGKNFEKGLARIYRGNSLIETLDLNEIPKTKNYKFTIDVSEYLFHTNDEVRIEIIGVDYFRTEKVLYKTIVEPLQLIYNIIPERKKIPKTVKGYRLQRSKLKK